VTLDVVTGELAPALPHRLTPAEAATQATWLREMMRSVLTEGEDYGTIPGTKRPTLFKAGAEMLVLAAGMRFEQKRIDDDDAREHRGITYTCTVFRGDYPQAVCDGYAGYDEHNYSPGRTSWNTIIKMAQKRALVGAALNAVAGSALFIADLDDNAPVEESPRRPASKPDVVCALEGATELVSTLENERERVRFAFRDWRKSKGYAMPPETPQILAEMEAELAKIRAEEARDSYEPPVGSPID
jgi:hypothetical protein